MLHERKQRVIDADFMLWISSDEVKHDFDFLRSFLETDCTNVDFLQQFLNGRWIPSFYKGEKSQNRKRFTELFKPEDDITHTMLCEALSTNYSLPSFFAKPVMARVDPRILRKHNASLKFAKLAFLEELLDEKEPRERYFGLLTAKTGRDFIISSDLAPFIIRFLNDNKEYKTICDDIPKCSLFARYIITRVLLIYDPEFRGRISRRAFQSHDFLSVLRSVAQFEQFSVAYDLFMKYDKEHVNGVTYKDFVGFDSSRVHPKIMERIWRFLPGDKPEEKLSFGDFVCFLLLLEDKSSLASLNFWFRVCDLEDDGVLSLGEMNTLYKYQKAKLRSLSLEAVKFKQILPQVMDMIGARSGSVTRGDLKKSGDWPLFFNFLVDTKRFADWEFKDPLYSFKTEEIRETPWDHFCREYANENFE